MTSVGQDAAHFFSNFGNDLLEPAIRAIDQHSAPILRTKEPTGFAFGPRRARPDVLPAGHPHFLKQRSAFVHIGIVLG